MEIKHFLSYMDKPSGLVQSVRCIQHNNNNFIHKAQPVYLHILRAHFLTKSVFRVNT